MHPPLYGKLHVYQPFLFFISQVGTNSEVLISCQKKKKPQERKKGVLQRKQNNDHVFAARTSSGWLGLGFFCLAGLLV